VPLPNVVKVADYLLLHGNGAKVPGDITSMIDKTRKVEGYTPKPILFNEDDHFDFDKESYNMLAATKGYVSWGYFDYRMKGEGFDDGYQSIPVNWKISSARKKAFFDKVKEITGN
jgi:hypothetical protein